MGTITLVRHGQASFGAANYDQLSALGQEQARLLGQWLQDTAPAPSRIALGPAQRHRQSAEHCLAVLPGAPGATQWQVHAGFDEFDHEAVLRAHQPAWTDPAAIAQALKDAEHPRRAFQQVFAAAVSRWVAGELRAPGLETWADFQARCRAALHQLTQERGQDVWVFTSGGVITALVQYVTGIPDARIFELNWTLANAGVTKLLYRGGERTGEFSLAGLNSVAHLERHRRPELITYR
jgi:broad specificity phosphatase PhoE